jgi:phosphatidylinositol kinase/protein kinase (PI-3  family)
LSLLANLEESINRVKRDRDKKIAHLDRDIVNLSTPQTMLIEVADLKDLVNQIQGILDRYHMHYYSKERNPTENIWNDAIGSPGIEHILHLVRLSLDKLPLTEEDKDIKQAQWMRNMKSHHEE